MKYIKNGTNYSGKYENKSDPNHFINSSQEVRPRSGRIIQGIIMAIRVVEFSRGGGIKLERFLHNQQTQLWINGELSKIGHHFSM